MTPNEEIISDSYVVCWVESGDVIYRSKAGYTRPSRRHTTPVPRDKDQMR